MKFFVARENERNLSPIESDIKNFILDKIILNSLQGTFYERLFSLRNRKRVHDSGVKATKWRMIVHVLEMVETKRAYCDSSRSSLVVRCKFAKRISLDLY